MSAPSRRVRGDVALEILVIAPALMLLIALAAAMVMATRTAAMVHDTASSAGYAAVSDRALMPQVAAMADLGAGSAVAGEVQGQVLNGWQNQLDWAAGLSHSETLANACANTAAVTGVALRPLALSDHGGAASAHVGVMLSFDYRCEVPSPALLRSFAPTFTVDGSWSEVAPWLVVP